MKLIRSNSSRQPSFPQWFDDFFTRDLSEWGLQNFSPSNTTLPAVNVFETNDDFTVEMAAPGMDKNDFEIELDNEMLTISSVRENRHEEKEGERFTRREFSYQSFKRSFHLPKSVVDESKIKAEYNNGLLRVVIPKREEVKAKPPRKISVK